MKGILKKIGLLCLTGLPLMGLASCFDFGFESIESGEKINLTSSNYEEYLSVSDKFKAIKNDVEGAYYSGANLSSSASGYSSSFLYVKVSYTCNFTFELMNSLGNYQTCSRALTVVCDKNGAGSNEMTYTAAFEAYRNVTITYSNFTGYVSKY